MTISFRAASSAGSGASATTTWALPAGYAAGDLSILGWGCKPYSVNVATPSGYAAAGNVTSGTNASGADVGSTRAAAFYRQFAATGEAAPTAGNTVAPSLYQTGAIALATSISGGEWNVASATGFQTTATTPLDITATTALDWAVGDWAVVLVIATSDNADNSSQSLTASGITFGSLTRRILGFPSTGDDGIYEAYTAVVTAGSGTVAPRFVGTPAAARTGLDATIVFLRVRDVTPAQATRVHEEAVEVATVIDYARVWTGTRWALTRVHNGTTYPPVSYIWNGSRWLPMNSTATQTIYEQAVEVAVSWP